MEKSVIRYLAACFALAAILAVPTLCDAQNSAQQGVLRAGAAKVDITPPLQPMSNGWPETLRDHLLRSRDRSGQRLDAGRANQCRSGRNDRRDLERRFETNRNRAAMPGRKYIHIGDSHA